MDIKNHNKGRKKPVMGKPFQIAVFTAVLLGIVLMVSDNLDLYRRLFMRKVFLI